MQSRAADQALPDSDTWAKTLKAKTEDNCESYGKTKTHPSHALTFNSSALTFSKAVSAFPVLSDFSSEHVPAAQARRTRSRANVMLPLPGPGQPCPSLRPASRPCHHFTPSAGGLGAAAAAVEARRLDTAGAGKCGGREGDGANAGG